LNLDRDVLIRLTALTKGPIQERRKQINKEFVKAALSEYNEHDIFDLETLSFKVKHLAKVVIPKEVIISILEELNIKKYIEHISEFQYRITKKFETPEFQMLTQPVWDEFLEFLKTRYKEYDPFIDENIKLVFNSILCTISLRILQSQDNQLDSLPINDFKEAINEEALKQGLSRPVDFPDIVFDYVTKEPPLLMRFIFDIYSKLINLDILSREQELPEIDF
jgi:hypothetical protein